MIVRDQINEIGSGEFYSRDPIACREPDIRSEVQSVHAAKKADAKLTAAHILVDGILALDADLESRVLIGAARTRGCSVAESGHANSVGRLLKFAT